ncbi:MAG: ribosome-recycling factor [Candidatus Shikimatogenerans bostrichidophilus]|nr:MAG: ribosome-recycling factor [Candidatus Shikimatogenerans bostrichidophilus]
MNKIFNDIDKKFNETLEYFYKYLSDIHFGRANISMLKNIKIDINNKSYNIYNIANINIIDKITFKIIPYENTYMNKIKKEILNHIEGTMFVKENSIILKLSLFTEEKRLDLINKIKIELEKVKNTLRKIRNKFKTILKNNKNLSEDEKINIKNKIQDIYKKSVLTLNFNFNKKKKEILNITT